MTAASIWLSAVSADPDDDEEDEEEVEDEVGFVG